MSTLGFFFKLPLYVGTLEVSHLRIVNKLLLCDFFLWPKKIANLASFYTLLYKILDLRKNTPVNVGSNPSFI